MATIHTAYGEGEVVEVEHGRMGKTRYKVAGYGFEMWLDATDPAIHTASNVDFGETDHSWDNSTTLPYKWEPKNPVEMYDHEQTISPDHELGYTPEERTHSSDSVTGESREDEHDYPGPAPHLFAAGFDHEPLLPPEHRAAPGAPSWQDHVNTDAQRLQDSIGNDTSNPAHPNHLPPPRHGAWERPAGLSAKFADVHEAFNPNDPADMFRHDPAGTIARHASFDRDAGLDPGVGDEQLVFESSREILKSAAWRDVRDKAVRIVREGGVHVEAMDTNAIYANVDGDSGTYECMILTGAAYPNGGFSGGKQAIANWKCDCEWGRWAFKRKFTFVGRLCSHGYAAYLTQASHNAKNDPNHGFRKRKKRSSVEEFKSWANDENAGHIDRDAADNYLSSSDEPVTREDAEKILDYVETHHSEHPERDYDVKGYHYDNDTNVLQHQPGKLTPHVYEIAERDEDKKHYFTDLGDDRKTTGPDQIQASLREWTAGDGDFIAHYPREFYAKGEPSEHHPAFAWHSEGKDDFPDSGIVHFSSLHLLADEDLLNRLRTMSEHGPAEHPHGAEGHNHEVSNVVDELHGRGYDAAPLVAMKRAALHITADDDDFSHFMEDPFGALASPVTGDQYSPGTSSGGASPTSPGAASGQVNTAPPFAGKGGDISSPKVAPPPGAANVAEAHPGGAGAPSGVASPAPAGPHPGGAQGPGNVPSPSTFHDGPGGTVTVNPGDTLNDIATSHGTSVGDIVKANPGANANSGTNIGANPDLIHPGDNFKLPSGASSPGGAGGYTPGSAGHGNVLGPPSPAAGAGGGAKADYKGWYGNGGGSGPTTAPAAPNPMPSSSPGTPAAPKVGALRFAELYFQGADVPGEGEDDKKSANPAAVPPTNQGVNYKQISQGDPQQARPQPQTGTGVASGGMSADAGSPNPNPMGAPQAGQPDQKHQQGGGLGGAGGAGLQQALGIAENVGGALGGALGGIPIVGPAISGVTNALSGLSGLGGALGGLGHMGAKEFAARYFEADGDFIGQGGGDWMDHSFAGSGPDRQNWSTTSEAYVDEHEGENRDETWVTDLDGDVLAYTTKRPKQSQRITGQCEYCGEHGHDWQVHPEAHADQKAWDRERQSLEFPFGDHHEANRHTADGGMLGGGDAGYGSTGGLPGGTLSTGGSGQGLGGSFTHAETEGGGPTMGTLTNTARVGTWGHGGEADSGFHNPRNPAPAPAPKMPGQPHKVPKKVLPPTNGAPPAPVPPIDEDDASSPERALSLMSSARDTDGSDIVRMFQASGGGCVSAAAGSGGHSDFDIAANAAKMLRTAGRNYSLAEQRELEDEEPVGGRHARNFDDLDLTGTHYVD